MTPDNDLELVEPNLEGIREDDKAEPADAGSEHEDET